MPSEITGDSMKEKPRWAARLWFRGSDGEASPIRKQFLDAAVKDSIHILKYADRKKVDPAVAQNIAEMLVEDIASKQEGIPASKRIREPGRYLYAAYVHAINALRKKEERYKHVPIAEVDRFEAVEAEAERIDNGILVNEIISMMDPETRRIWWRLHEGYQWKEIAWRQGLTVNAAKIAYARGREKVRAKIERGHGNPKP
jgi:DNA-directed RNA polymerase specialized sigma24 family protein